MAVSLKALQVQATLTSIAKIVSMPALLDIWGDEKSKIDKEKMDLFLELV